jgi:hypothetical protein
VNANRLTHLGRFFVITTTFRSLKPQTLNNCCGERRPENFMRFSCVSDSGLEG